MPSATIVAEAQNPPDGIHKDHDYQIVFHTVVGLCIHEPAAKPYKAESATDKLHG